MNVLEGKALLVVEPDSQGGVNMTDDRFYEITVVIEIMGDEYWERFGCDIAKELVAEIESLREQLKAWSKSTGPYG